MTIFATELDVQLHSSHLNSFLAIDLQYIFSYKELPAHVSKCKCIVLALTTSGYCLTHSSYLGL